MGDYSNAALLKEIVKSLTESKQGILSYLEKEDVGKKSAKKLTSHLIEIDEQLIELAFQVARGEAVQESAEDHEEDGDDEEEDEDEDEEQDEEQDGEDENEANEDAPAPESNGELES